MPTEMLVGTLRQLRKAGWQYILEKVTLWIRRRNTTDVNEAYQLGGISLNVIPEPTTLGLLGFISGELVVVRRFRM